MSTSSSWAVATPHDRATLAAENVFERGGNAVDAALAAASVLTVAYPHQCSIGGDCIAMVGLPDGTVHVINGVGRTPAAFTPADLAAFSTMPIDGPQTVTVPGAIGAWHTMADRWGSIGLAADLSAAAQLAADGVPVAPGLARDLQREKDRILADPGLRAVFAPDGSLLTAGELLVQPNLAASLRAIADRGHEAFYQGDIAHSIVETLRGLGSAMSDDDFAQHRTVVTSPISAIYDGTEYLTAPPPSQGAFFLESIAALEMVRASTDAPIDLDGPEALRVAEILHAAAEDRDRLLGDPDHSPLDVPRLLNERARQLADRQAVPLGGQQNPPPTGDTVAVVTADGTGMWVSLIQSLFHAFGAGILDPRTGIILHNRGASFSMSPDHPGAVAAGRRPPHTLMPVLTRNDGVLTGAHGTMGGRAQAQIHTQLALRLAGGDSPDVAINRARWILGTMEEGARGQRVVKVEDGVPAVVTATLREGGFAISDLEAHDDGAGHAQLVRQGKNGKVGASDPRSDGTFRGGRT